MKINFSFSRTWRLGMSVIFMMTSMVQATPKQREAVVKVVMAEIPWNQRPMKLTELMTYGKDFLPPILLQQLQANYMLYGDIEIPKMEVSKVKVGSEEHVRLMMTEKGVTNTITLIDNGKVFARLNDKVDILVDDMRSLTTVVFKVYQAIPVQPPKGPFLDDWDYRRLTPRGRAEYIKKIREILVLMEQIQNSSGQGSSPKVSWNFHFDNSTSEAEVELRQNQLATSAGVISNIESLFSPSSRVFHVWWDYVLARAQAGGTSNGPVIIAGGVYDSKADYNKAKNKAGCTSGQIYCHPDMAPMGEDKQCVKSSGSDWTKQCFEGSADNLSVKVKGEKEGKQLNILEKLNELNSLLKKAQDACTDKKSPSSKDSSACFALQGRIYSLRDLYQKETASNAPSTTSPGGTSVQGATNDLARTAEINTYCGQKQLNGANTKLLGSSELGALSDNATAMLSTSLSKKEKITTNSSFKAYCQCEVPAISEYEVAPSVQAASVTNSTLSSSSSASAVKSDTALALKNCKTPEPEKPSSSSGGGSRSRSQWWNPNSWCESSTCRMGVSLGAVGLTLGLGIMGYRQSMKQQERQQKAQQEWYASMLGTGTAATMPPMSLYTPSAWRPTDVFNTNSTTNSQDTLR